MNFRIQEWPDKSATLMLDDGTHLVTYSSVDEAIAVCEEWYQNQLLHEDDTTLDPTCSSLC